MDATPLYSRPIFFKRNRVFRVYQGGKLFHDFFGDPAEDSNYPEEWVASQVRALNSGRDSETEGLSFIEGTNLTFAELMSRYKSEMLGDTQKFDLLVKILDSAVRLPIQAHPDKSFSREHFRSEYGKTEMWLILQTRPDACIYLGFKDKIDRTMFARLIEESRTDKNRMVPYLNKIHVRPGDVFLIPPKTVHAIGPGCLILEVQEPTDFTIQPEYWCGDYPLNNYEMYLGLDKETALDCFDFSQFGLDIVHTAKKAPLPLQNRPGYRKELLIGKSDTPCFQVFRHSLQNTAFDFDTAPSLFIVTNGTGMLRGKDYSRVLQKGDYFFLPHCANNQFRIQTECSLQLVECSI